MASHISNDWLAEHVVPNIAKRYQGDHGLIQNLGLALLFVMLDEDASLELFKLSELPTVGAVRQAYKAIPAADKPEQPIDRIPLHVYRIGEETFIDEVWGGAEEQQQQTTRGNNPEAALAQVPASVGGAATQ
jgi:hypothetical protein